MLLLLVVFVVQVGADHLPRVGSWCVGGVESKPDTLDLLLYNEVSWLHHLPNVPQGKPLDILLLQSTKGKVRGNSIIQVPFFSETHFVK